MQILTCGKSRPAGVETKKEKSPLTHKEKVEYENMEKEIAKLEQKKLELNKQLNGSTTDHYELMRISIELGNISKLIDEKMMRWMELEEKQG